MELTNDQYYGLSKLEKWYKRYNHQYIDISGVIGTGTWDLVQAFIDNEQFDPREVMYLSFNQKQVLELASKRLHAYYINGFIYNYTRIVDFDTLPVLNYNSNSIDYKWKKEVRKKIDVKYKLIVVLDSILLNEQILRDIGSFGLPIILLRDPALTPVPDSYVFLRDPNIQLREVHPVYARSPITHFAHKILLGEDIKPGSYDVVSIVPKKQMNLYNLKSSDMTITMSNDVRSKVNSIYRERILKQRSSVNVINEKIIIMDNMYAHKITNPDEKKIKIYLAKGTVGYISKINHHVPSTKYVPIEFRPEFYHESFDELVLNRHSLNNIQSKSRQMIPDEEVNAEYAYALTAPLARLSHWDKVTLIADEVENGDTELQRRMMYSAITRAKRSITILI